jgi:hypothetical protein
VIILNRISSKGSHMDKIQQLFLQQPELVELLAKHGDRRSYTWSGEVDPTGTFSFIITYEFSPYSWDKITKKMYFKYLPVIEQDYRSVMIELRDKAYELTSCGCDGVHCVYEESKVVDKNGVLRTEDSLLHSDRERYGTGIHSWNLFQKFIEQLKEEQVRLDNLDPITEMFRYSERRQQLLVKRYFNLDDFDQYHRSNYGCSNYARNDYGNYKPEIKVNVDDCDPYSCCIEVKTQNTARVLRLQFIRSLDLNAYEKVIEQLKHVSNKDRYIVIYRELLIQPQKLNSLTSRVYCYDEKQFEEIFQ